MFVQNCIKVRAAVHELPCSQDRWRCWKQYCPRSAGWNHHCLVYIQVRWYCTGQHVRSRHRSYLARWRRLLQPWNWLG